MSGKRAARHAQPSGAKRWLIGLAAVLGAVAAAVALVVVLGWVPGSGDDDTASKQSASGTATSGAPRSQQATSPSPSPDGGGADRARVPKALRACATSVSRAARTVKAARQGVQNWSDHVQARTDMLEGRMSMDTMDAIWTRTKKAGPADQERFRKALDAYDAPSACTKVKDVPAADRSMAQRCTQRSEAANRAVRSAKAAMRDWEVHLANMAKFADGDMSAAMAQGRWVAAWRNAPSNINAYREAREALDKAPACRVNG
jgi:hypothetical protein